MGSSFAKAFGKLIRSHRTLLKLTQREVAEHLGVTVQAVWNWEKGRATPGAENQARLIGLLKIGPDDLHRTYKDAA